jgi:hypothetical protein
MKFTDTDNFPHPNLGMVIAEMSPHSEGAVQSEKQLRRREKLHFAKVSGVALSFTELPTFGRFWCGALAAVLRPHPKRVLSTLTGKQVSIANLNLP